MTSAWKIIAPIAIIAVVIIAIAFYQTSKTPQGVAPSTGGIMPTPAPLSQPAAPTITSSQSAPDVTMDSAAQATVDAIFNESTGEQTTLNQEEADLPLLNQDDKQVNAFNQTYDETSIK